MYIPNEDIMETVSMGSGDTYMPNAIYHHGAVVSVNRKSYRRIDPDNKYCSKPDGTWREERWTRI